ncbi:helix-turn-helix domain-containing protein [Autumnicola psychrophila]|uniref:AraC family transcriptional regulator n=1 Tax=Autumnicola psychrophila TaxID=3075592 RepID=A0ABU3DQD1_9FLAO|nr:AraC family transcriptional regulator [Zunongwangia sp. F225]MDT0685928.1 AraC family transcriptional regulator [Zunongwangia sp. F225]
MILILLIAAIFGFVLSTTLFLKKSTNTTATRILGSFYFLLSVYALQAYIIDGGYLEHFTWFFLWPLLPYNLLFVPIYYYFKVIITDQLEWQQEEIFLFIPFFLGLIDVGYVYLQPDSFYNNIISQAISSPQYRLEAEYWLLSLDQHLLMRHLWQFSVLVALMPQILSFINKEGNDKLKSVLNKWLLIFWGTLMLMAILASTYAIEKIFEWNLFQSFVIIGKNGGIVTLILYMVLFLIGIIPIYFPSILHGYPQSVKPSRNTITENLKFGLNKQEVGAKLESLKENKLYLNQNFNLTACAKELDMPSHHISYFLEQQYGLSFADYKSTLRIEHVKKLIKEGFLENNTIDALAEECGYASGTSLSITFKSHVGVRPREYAISLK